MLSGVSECVSYARSICAREAHKAADSTPRQDGINLLLSVPVRPGIGLKSPCRSRLSRTESAGNNQLQSRRAELVAT